MYLNITKRFREKIFRKPTQAIIETTNRCNLNCPFCMVGMQNELLAEHGTTAHDLMTRPLGSMSEDTFNAVKRELRTFGIKKVYLHFQGEPMLNKLTPKFASELKKDRFEVGIFTNGLVFNDENIAELADIEIDLIRFSVDGASEKSYQQNRVGGQFIKVYENMKKVVHAHDGKKTRIEWQFLALRNNEHEVNEAKEMASELGINFFVKGFRETDPHLAPTNQTYRAKALKKPCTDIYHQVGIYWNGDVVPCCYDVDGKEIMGNLNDNSIVKIWNSEKYKLFRKKIAAFNKSTEAEPIICKSCLRWK